MCFVRGERGHTRGLRFHERMLPERASIREHEGEREKDEDVERDHSA